MMDEKQAKTMLDISKEEKHKDKFNSEGVLIETEDIYITPDGEGYIKITRSNAYGL
jgi:hypothetical protein